MSAVFLLIAISNWVLGARLYPNNRIVVSSALVVTGVAGLLVFGTIESVRRRLGTRKRDHVVG
jgi:hypothetical protein